MTERAIRAIWTDKLGLTAVAASEDLEPGVYAIIGPIESHVSEPEFQEALSLVAIRRNRRFGFLGLAKFRELLQRYRRGTGYAQ